MRSLAAFGDRVGLDRAGVWHALRLALAAWLAFAIAARLHVHYAYWAAMPIWVVSQSSRGLLIERAFFRTTGTLVGAAVGFGVVRAPLGPYGQLVLLSLWIAANAGLTHLLRGVHGYGALMAGMTAAVVAVPTLLSPGASLELGLARVECTLIGVIVVTLVTGLHTPGARTAELYDRVRRLSADAIAYAARLLGAGHVRDVGARDGHTIVIEMSELDATARLITAGSVEGYRRMRHVDSLVVGSLSVMAAAAVVGARYARATSEAIDPRRRYVLATRLGHLAERIRTSPRDGLVADEAWLTERPEDPAHERLHGATRRILEADAALLSSHPAPEARSFGRKLAYLAPHREWTLALETAALAGAMCLLVTGLAYASAWPPARQGALGICIIFLVLSSMPQPQVIAPHLLKGLVAGVATGIVYRLAIQPTITSTPHLLLSVAPFILLGGFARASRRTALPAIDFNMGFLLSSQAGMPASSDVRAVLEGSVALLLGAALVAATFIVMPRRHERLARNAAAAIRADLHRLIDARRMQTSAEWHARAARQILRLTLHLGRATSPLGERLPRGTLAALNLGHAITDLNGLDGDDDAARVRASALTHLASYAERPRETAEALRSLAGASDAATQQVLLDIADALMLAEDVLSFGAARPALSRSTQG